MFQNVRLKPLMVKDSFNEKHKKVPLAQSPATNPGLSTRLAPSLSQQEVVAKDFRKAKPLHLGCLVQAYAQ